MSSRPQARKQGMDRGVVVALLAMAVAIFVIANDFTAVSVALPSMKKDFDPARASLAGGIVYMFQVAGGAVGLGLTTTVFTIASQDKLSSEVAAAGISVTGSELDAVHGVLAGTDSALQAVSGLTAVASQRVTELVEVAFTAGMQWGFRLNLLLAIGGLIVSVLFVGGSLLGSRRGE